MNRPWLIAVAFSVCLAMVLAALSWTSAMVLRLDAAESRARRQAALEESVRLALWRIDSAMASLIIQESARPYADYFAGSAPAVGKPGAVHPRLPAFVTSPGPYTLLYFQVAADGSVTSPQTSAEPGGASIELWASRLDELSQAIDHQQLLAAAPPKPEIEELADIGLPPQAAIQPFVSQEARNRNEFRARAQNFANSSAMNQIQVAPLPASTAASGGLMTPVWSGDRLLLVRRAPDGQTLQGCWLDWPAIDVWLTSLVRDLLPEARLEAAAMASGEEASRRLSTLPVEIDPGNVPADESAAFSPLRLSLAVAWGCVLLAALAIGVLLVGVVGLSERRAAFVSAVTHELRTPLTTFRMYAEMLAEGMVPSADDRERYLLTLRAEAERLSHLVENVLAYARLERGHGRRSLETLPVSGLLERVAERLGQRTGQAGMQLVVEAETSAQSAELRTDPSAVEMILFNLVDNGCKYAATATDRRLHLEVARAGGKIEFRVRDHGPGIAPGQARRLFRPFSKSARDAAHSAPGVGLGLALSRRLARQLGGDLRLEPREHSSACFILALPLP